MIDVKTARLMLCAQAVIDNAPVASGNLSGHLWELRKAVSAFNEVDQAVTHE